MTVDSSIQDAAKEFESAMTHLQGEYAKLQVGRANPALVESVSVEAYGTSQPLKAVASISVPEPRTIQIQPWDKGMLAAIEKGILNASLGLNPVNDGVCVRLAIPPLTEERRSELAKLVHKLAEDAKISIRNVRQDGHKQFKQLKDSGDITEDDLHGAERKLQEKVDDFNKRIEEMATGKEKDVMTV
jgi:ribosome recycling factor